MKGFGSIFPALAFVLAALLTAGAGPASAAEPSEKLRELQNEAAQLYQAGSYGQALPAAKQALAQAVAGIRAGQRAGRHPDLQRWPGGGGSRGLCRGGTPIFGKRAHPGDRVWPGQRGRRQCAWSALGTRSSNRAGLPRRKRYFLRELKIWRDLQLGEHAVSATAYSGLGAVNLARGDYNAALANYRKAVQQLTSQTAAQAVARSVIEAGIKEHRDIFIGLGRAAAGLRRQAGADEPALMEESFAAGQRAWATSAASALAKMTARLKAGETELGRAVRHLDTLNERILDLHQQDMSALTARYAIQQADPAYRETLDAFRAVSLAHSKDNAPIMKRQRELRRTPAGAFMKRCAGGQRAAGCEASERERNAISRGTG